MSSIANFITGLAPIVGGAAGLVALTACFVATVGRTLRALDPGSEPEWWPEFERQFADCMTSSGGSSAQSPGDRTRGRVP
jgi:hypothetical protein